MVSGCVVNSLTWPPLKPTATTPRSWRSGMNFAWCGGGAVIFADDCGSCQFAIVVECGLATDAEVGRKTKALRAQNQSDYFLPRILHLCVGQRSPYSC